jgi:hypothetical protein
VWAPQLRARARAGEESGDTTAPVRGLWRNPVAWQVTGLQSLNYYAVAWLPTVLTDAGLAGWLLSFSGLLGTAGAFLAPNLAARGVHSGLLATASAVLCALRFAGLLIAPITAAYLWMALLGLGQGAAFSWPLSSSCRALRTPATPHNCPAWRSASATSLPRAGRPARPGRGASAHRQLAGPATGPDRPAGPAASLRPRRVAGSVRCRDPIARSNPKDLAS